MIIGVILARNEELNIATALTALRPHVGELILIDMESSDRTVEVAQPLVDRVLTHPFVANFDAARNIAIDAAKYDWLWFIDADERVPPETGRMVQQLVRERGHEFEALVVPFATHFCGQWMQHCGWWPGYTMPRVLKRGHFRFSEKLHGGVEVIGRTMYTPADRNLAIEHFSYRDVEHYIEKLNRYTSTEAKQFAEQGMRWDWRAATRHMTHDLWQYYEANQGRFDGARGWVLSWLSGQYRWLSHAKLVDREPVIGEKSKETPESATSPRALATDEDRAPDADCPQSLDEVLDLMRQEVARLRAKTFRGPLGVVWVSPLWDLSGYADDGRTQIKALAQGERPLTIVEHRWNDQRAALPVSDVALLRALMRADRPPVAATITSCIPSLVNPDPAAALNVIRTMFETDRIPVSWLESLSRFDQIWTLSRHNFESFRRSGVAPERLRVVPACVDTEQFRPEGERLQLPPSFDGKFVFLSMFDWQLRKGWDVLLRAYARAFSPTDPVRLLLKVTRGHGHPESLIHRQADEVLAQVGSSLASRPDIVFSFDTLSTAQLAALYRSAQAFVLPTRGEGWGRPFIEAMASGIPVIGPADTGNAEFMNASNCFLVPSELVDVPEAAAKENPFYRGHRWFEPNEDELVRLMCLAANDHTLRDRIAREGCAGIRRNFNLERGRIAMEAALSDAESRMYGRPTRPPAPDAVRVEWEGEFFAGHSFSNINQVLTQRIAADGRIELAPRRVAYNPTYDQDYRFDGTLRNLLKRLPHPAPQVTVRHSYPPNWRRPTSGKWVHIQPWEFGHLPLDWIHPLRGEVDEIWAPSHYVRQVYERSGIPAEKIHVIPWGVDCETFNPRATSRLLPTQKRFKFLFVGGTIYRKGFDVLLEAYLKEFNRSDDVCLVIKDMGGDTYYRFGNCREQVEAAIADPNAPEVVYFGDRMTPGQLASIYTACNCLAAPYRGEGFGLPILEAMACGLPPIIPRGGAADDFTDDETAIYLPTTEVADTHDMPLCGPALALSASVEDLRRAFRQAFENANETAERGKLAAERTRDWTWERTARCMTDRILHLVGRDQLRRELPVTSLANSRKTMIQDASDKAPVTLCVELSGASETLADCLALAQSFASQILVADRTSSDDSKQIAREYGSRVIEAPNGMDPKAARTDCESHATQPWILWLTDKEFLAETDARQIARTLAGQTSGLVELTTRATESRLYDESGNPTDRLRLFRRTSSPR